VKYYYLTEHRCNSILTTCDSLSNLYMLFSYLCEYGFKTKVFKGDTCATKIIWLDTTPNTYEPKPKTLPHHRLFYAAMYLWFTLAHVGPGVICYTICFQCKYTILDTALVCTVLRTMFYLLFIVPRHGFCLSRTLQVAFPLKHVFTPTTMK
jgi:hypothetical protein